MQYKNQHDSNSAIANSNIDSHNVATEIKNEYAQCKRQLAKYQNSTTATCVAVVILATPIFLTILFIASENKNFKLLSIAVGILIIAIILSVVAIVRTCKRNKLSNREWQLRKEYAALKSIIGKDKALDVNSISRDEISLLSASNELQQDTDKENNPTSLGRTILIAILGAFLFVAIRWLLFSEPKPDMTPSTTNRNTTVTQPTTTTQQTTTTQPTYTQPTYTHPQSVHCSSHTIGESTYTNCY